MELLVIVLLLLLSGFFSGSEIAYVTANRLRTEVRAQREGFIGRVVRDFIREPSTFLTTTLVGNNVALVVYSTLMTFYLAPPFQEFWLGLLGAEAAVDGLVLVSQTIVATFLVLIVGEIIPKSLLREPADRVVFAFALPLKITYWLLLPLVKLAGWTSNVLVRLLGADAQTFRQFLARDFEVVIRESRESGSLDLDVEESEILSNVFELRMLRVKDSMVPRTEIEAVDENASMDEVRQRFIDSGYSRLPGYRENIDNIVGVVLAHDLFQHPESLAEVMRPAMYVPEAKRARDLLYEFLQRGGSIAVVIDEYGGTAGIVTVEDLLEELFGDIRDEFDVDEDPMQQLDEHTFVVSGRTELDELAEEFGLQLPEGDYDTVAGFLIDRLSAIPVEGAEFDFEGHRFVVTAATANRIESVKIVRGGAVGDS
jgi:putative hemolysin